MTFQRRFDMMTPHSALVGLDDRRLALIAADRRLRHFDPDLVGDLQLHALIAEPRSIWP